MKIRWAELKTPISQGPNNGKKNVNLGEIGRNTSRTTPPVTVAVAKLMDWHLSNFKLGKILTGKTLVDEIKTICYIDNS